MSPTSKATNHKHPLSHQKRIRKGVSSIHTSRSRNMNNRKYSIRRSCRHSSNNLKVISMK